MEKSRNFRGRIPKTCQAILLYSFCSIFSLSALESENSSLEIENEESQSSKEKISDWEARLELARVLSYLKRFDESIQEYQKLLQAKPQSIATRIEMAKVLFYQNKTDAALAELSKIPSQELDDETWIMIADMQRKKKSYAEAEKIYNQHLKKFPQDDKVRLKLAELLSWQKHYEDSIHHYRIILSRWPKDIQIRRRYAQVLTWAKKDEEAAEEWKKTLK